MVLDNLSRRGGDVMSAKNLRYQEAANRNIKRMLDNGVEYGVLKQIEAILQDAVIEVIE